MSTVPFFVQLDSGIIYPQYAFLWYKIKMALSLELIEKIIYTVSSMVFIFFFFL